MDPFTPTNLISTKDAGELSGYTSDYLARLARSKKIIGQRIGHSWFIDRASLENFLKGQKDKKVQYARILSDIREQEYRAHRSPLRKFSRTLTSPIQVPQLNFLRREGVAIGTALVVVLAGVATAHAAFVPGFTARISEIAYQAADGFALAFGDIPARVASRIAMSEESASLHHARVMNEIARGTENVAPKEFSSPDLSFVQMQLPSEAPAPMRAIAVSAPRASAVDLADVFTSARAIAKNPQQLRTALARAYVSLGEFGYSAATASMSVYESLIARAGDGAFAFGVSARDTLAHAPSAVNAINLAFGNAVIDVAHGAIDADTLLAYGLAEAAPESARVTVAFVGGLGNVLAGATAETPRLATTAYLGATALPAKVAPALAEAVFNAEYAAAEVFLDKADRVASAYLGFINGAGEVTYVAASGTARAVATAPLAIENAYLGALGTGALALNSLAETLAGAPGASYVAAAVNATLPALTPLEQVALSTYQTVHGAFLSTSNSLAALFAPPPTIVVPAPTSVHKAPLAQGTTTPSRVTAYPTYNTIVQGASQAYIDDSIASLRGSLMQQVVALIQPVAQQSVTNMTTIQQVNMIDDLSDLIVRNGDFRNSTMTGGNVVGASGVSATNGTFQNLSGTAVTIGTTTIGSGTVTGNFTVYGTITPSVLTATSSITAPYFAATGSNATSTFAGALNVDSGAFVYATTSRSIGIGTTTPWGLLSINPDGILGPSFAIGSTTRTDFVVSSNGRVGIGSSTPDAMFSILQNSNGVPLFSARRATDSAPTGDFIDYRSNAGAILFRVDNSGNLLAGGIVNSGSQTITSTSTPQFRVQYDTTNEWTTTVNSAGATTFAVNGSTPSLSFMPQINSVNTFNFTNAASTSVLSIDTLNSRVGIGTTSPKQLLTLSNAGAAGQLLLEDTAASADQHFWTLGASRGVFSLGTMTDALATTTRFTIDASGNVGIGTTSPGAALSVAGSGLFNNSLTAYGAVAGASFTSTTTTASQFLYASTTQLSAYGSLVVGGTSTTTLAADGNSSTIFGPLTVKGTSVQAGSLTIQRGNTNGDNSLFLNDQTGSTLLKLYTNANTGHGLLRSFQSFLDLGTNSGGTALSIDTSNQLNISGHIVPTSNQVYDLGASADYFRNAYINNIVANNLSSASTSIAGTNNTSFSINSNNPTTDGQDMSLIFYRGAGAPSNAVLSWNSTLKRFEFNQNAYIANASASTASTTLRIAAVASQTAALTSWLDSAGATLATLTAGGSLGVGSSSPFAKLAIHANNGDTNTQLLTVASSTASATTTLFTVLNTGLVGIGSTTPWGLLSVNASASAGVPLFVVGSSTATNFLVDGGGKVAVGTSTADAKSTFTINGNTSATLPPADLSYLLRINAPDASAQGSMLFDAFGGANSVTFRRSDGTAAAPTALTTDDNIMNIRAVGYNSSGAYSGAQGSIRIVAAEPWTSSAEGTYINFLTTATGGTTLTERMRISASGNVGIGTTTPQEKLVATGGVLITGSLNASSDLNGGAITGGGLGLDVSTNIARIWSAQALGFFPGAAEAARFTAAGNLGIGTTTPYSPIGASRVLTIEGAAASVSVRNSSSGTPSAIELAAFSGNTALYSNDSSNFNIYTSGSNRFTVASGGNVGVGTTSPSTKFTVNGDIMIQNTSAPALRIRTTDSVGSSEGINLGVSTGANQFITGSASGDAVLVNNAAANLLFGTGGSERARITSNGDLLVGTTTAGSNFSKYIYLASSGGTALTLQSTSATVGSMFSLAVGAASGRNFGIYDERNSAYRLVIDNSGNVGIGTTTPQEKLVATGGVLITGSLNASSDLNGGAITGGGLGLDVSTNIARIWSAQALGFFPGAAEAARFTAAGNLGIGTSSPFAKLSISATVSNSTQFVVENATPSSGSTSVWFRDTDTSTHTIFRVTGDSDRDSGGPYEFVVNQVGQVGIGTTTPGSSYKLDVYGTSSNNIIRSGTSGTVNSAYVAVGNAAREWWIGTAGTVSGYNNGPLLFYDSTAGATRALFDNAGNFAIGNISPSGRLHVYSTGQDNTVYLEAGTAGFASNLYLKAANSAGASFNNITSYNGSTIGWKISGAQDSANADVITFRTGASATERVRIDGSGNVGIGTTTAVSNDAGVTQILAIGGSGTPAIVLKSTNSPQEANLITDGSGFYMDVGGSGTAANNNIIFRTVNANNSYGYVERLRVRNDGSVTPGQDNAQSLGNSSFHWDCVYYDATTLGTCTSDSRLKSNIADFSLGTDPLAQVTGLRPRTFEYNSNPGVTNYGFIAQEVQQVAPEMVEVGSDGYYQVKYGYLQYLQLEALQQLANGFSLHNAGTGATSTISSYYTGTSTPAITVDAAGNVGIGMDTPTHMLQVAGDIGAISFVNTSTRSSKTDITYLTTDQTDHLLAELRALKPATYLYKIESPNDPLRLGLIAEDAAAAAPEIVSPDGKGVDVYKMATFTLAGVQSLAAKVDAHETRITSLEARVTALESGAISSSSGTTTFSTSTLASALEGFGVLIKNGIAQFNTLVFRQLVASKDADGTSSAGSVVILTGNTVAQVNNSLVKPSTKVFVTFNAQIQGSWWVSDKMDGSFRVVLSQAQTTDVSFDYFLVQTEGQIATSTPTGYVGYGVSQSSGPDTVAPVITLLGDNPLYLSVGGTFTEPGVTVTDNADGTDPYLTFVNGIQQDISGGLDTSSPINYIITYQVTDHAGNMATAHRSVVVGNPDGTTPSGSSSSSGTTTPADTTAPVVTLNGSAAMQLNVGDVFTDPGATATDDTDGAITPVVSGAVDTATAGLYTLTYSATDAAGNAGSASRTVSVVAATSTTP